MGHVACIGERRTVLLFLKERGGRAQTGRIWLRTGTEAGYCEHGNGLTVIKFSLLCINQIHSISRANKMHYTVYTGCGAGDDLF